MADKDKDTIEQITKNDGLLRQVIREDRCDDWRTVRDFGELMLRIDGESATGNFLIARACRHLGERVEMSKRLAKCRELIRGIPEDDSERQCLIEALVAEEESD